MTARARRARATALSLVLCALPAAAAAPAGARAPAGDVHVIVRLAPPPLALVSPARRQLMGVGSTRRLDAASFGSRLYLARVRSVQDAFAARLRSAVSGASVERRYGVVLDALAVRLPVRSLARVEQMPGVAAVYPVATYHALADTVPAIVGAVPLWGVDRSTAGQGVKVGIIDDGIDAGAPFLAPAGLSAPAGFPRGQRRFTSGRVIVARSFAGGDAPGPDHLAFDPAVSEHGTHVSGIVAGAYGTVARPGMGLPTVHGLSGVAPGAWLGNYRGLARGDHESGAIGSTEELAAAVDSAVKDGMDVLNLSLGGPEIDPAADALSLALANAARAGVPSVVAAGNDFDSRGFGSISSPGSSVAAITVAATSSTRVFGVIGSVRAPNSPALEAFTAVPSSGPRIPRALTRLTRLARPNVYGLDMDGCRQGKRRSALRAVVLLRRGGCGFGTKAINAHEAGAVAVIVESDRPGPPFLVEEETDLPLLVVTDSVGKALRSYISSVLGDGRAQVRFTRSIAEVPTPPRVLTDFSSAGPTPFDQLLKPDISAPGEAILSSVPIASSDFPGAFASWEGTSMAAPAVTGVVALMRGRHPEWTPEQIREALIGSGAPAYADSDGTVEASPLRTGGGFVDAAGAVAPGVFSDPPMLGFGLQRPGASVTVPVSVSDAGDGAGTWQVAIAPRGGSGAAATAPAQVTVPAGGAALLPVTLTVAGDAREGDVTGSVVLAQGARTRHIPYWAHVERPQLASAPARLLTHPGIIRGTTHGRPNRVLRYRYPAYTGALGLPVRWHGGEALYRFHLSRRAINVGVTVEPLADGGLRPFLLRGLDENRVAGESGLPIDVGPSLTDDPVPSAGLYWAPPGDYAVAVDSAGRSGGPFRLRFWVNDVTPPALGRLRASHDARTLSVPVTDAGSGVDPRYLECALVQEGSSLDRACRPDWNARTGIATIHVNRLAAGRYALAVRAGDYAESRDALAIAISPQHVRTRVIGLEVGAGGAIRVAAAPRSAAFDARRQVAGG